MKLEELYESVQSRIIAYNDIDSHIIADCEGLTMDDVFIKKCSCGAIYIYIDNVRESFSMCEDTFIRCFSEFAVNIQDDKFLHCDHCVNHWGVDLCACGSGELVGECQEGLSMCNKPHQNIIECATYLKLIQYNDFN